MNSTTAWLYGCSAANCALLGFGERTGNPPLEGAIMDYISLLGDTNGVDTRVITEIAEYFKNEVGVDIPIGYPFIGTNFNVTSAGIHADGMLKNEEIYKHLRYREDPQSPMPCECDGQVRYCRRGALGQQLPRAQAGIGARQEARRPWRYLRVGEGAIRSRESHFDIGR